MNSKNILTPQVTIKKRATLRYSSSKKITSSSICRIYIYIFCIYISFETVILNFLPSAWLGIVRYGIEVLGYFILICAIFFQRKKIYLGKQEKAILFVILIIIFNIFINMVDMKIAILGFRWILRYLYIYFIIYLGNWDRKDINKFLNLIKVIMLIEIVLSFLQLVARNIMDVILLPQYENIIDGINTYSLQRTSQYALYASFGRYGEYGYFIAFALWIWIAEYYLAKQKKERKLSIYMIVIWCVIFIFSYSRQGILATLIAFLIFIINYNRSKLTRKQMTLLMISILVFLFMSIILLSGFEMGRGTINEGIAQRFLSVFSKDFILADFIGKGRTWFYTVASSRLLSHKPLLGFGIGMFGCQTAIQYNTSVHEMLNIPTRFSMDVYIVSILGQIGIIGLVFLIKMYLISIKNSINVFCSKVMDLFSKKIAIITFGYCITALVMTLFSSSLSDRYLAFYLWCMIAFQRKYSQC